MLGRTADGKRTGTPAQRLENQGARLHTPQPVRMTSQGTFLIADMQATAFREEAGSGKPSRAQKLPPLARVGGLGMAGSRSPAKSTYQVD